MKFPRLLTIGLFATLMLSACGAKIENDLLTALPSDAHIIFGFDLSDGEQRENLEEIWEQLPHEDLRKNLEENYDEEEFKKDILPIVKGDLEVAIAVIYPDTMEALEAGELDAYVAVHSEEPEKFEQFLRKHLLEGSPDMKESKEGDFEYWTSESDEYYLAHQGEIFVLTNNAENRELAVENLTNASGFERPDEYEGKLVYVHVDSSIADSVLSDFYGDYSMANVWDAMEGVDMTVEAEEDGFALHSEALYQGKEAAMNVFGDTDYQVSLAEVVNADGLMMYAEQSNFALLFEPFTWSFLTSLNQADPSLVPETWNENYLGAWAESLDMSEEDFRTMLNAPFAISSSDVGQLYPTFTLLLDLDEEYADEAQKVVLAMDGWLDQLIAQFDALMEPQGFGVGALKKDVGLVGGGGLHRLYFDFSALPEDILAAAVFVPGLSIEDTKVEFYYGLTGDGKFVMALYPDFAEAYGENVLAESEVYQDAFDRIGGEEGFSVSYLNPEVFVGYLGRLVDLAAGTGSVPPNVVEGFDLYGRRMIGSFKYMVSRSWLDGDILRGEGFMKVEEVK